MNPADVGKRYSDDLFQNSLQHGQHLKRDIELMEAIMELQERVTALEASIIGNGLTLYERRKEEETEQHGITTT